MIKLTKSFIDRLPTPKKKDNGQATQVIYRDESLIGFGLLVGSGGTKSFFIERRIGSRIKRVSIGRYGLLTPTQAKLKAQEMLGDMAMGNDPAAKKKELKATSMTLQQAFDDYLVTRKNLKSGTIKNYQKCLDGCLSDWLSKRLVDIDKDMIETRHRELGQKAPARANNTMRVLRAVFNHAMAKFEDSRGHPVLKFNPVGRLSQNRAWYPIERRQTLVKPHQLQAWYEATLLLNQETTRDYLHFLLFTGLRKTEAATLMWSNVDFKDRTITLLDTKNSDDHILPLSDFLERTLKGRKAVATSNWVFESPVYAGEPLKEARTAIKRVSELSGIAFTAHDLRRTFITIAESLDIPAYALKRLLNHRDSNDMTASYIVSDVERLRRPMQSISDFIREKIIDRDLECET